MENVKFVKLFFVEGFQCQAGNSLCSIRLGNVPRFMQPPHAVLLLTGNVWGCMGFHQSVGPKKAVIISDCIKQWHS